MTTRTDTEHRHGYYPYTSAKPRRRSKCVSIGTTTCLQQHTSFGGDTVAGFIFGHEAPDLPVRCDGSLLVEPLDGRPVWGMTGSLTTGDLTLTPSVLCRRDGFHGFVRDGKWVEA